MVSVVLDNLADGMSKAEILEQYPSLQDADITTAMRYAAWISRGEIIPFAPHPESNAA